ncbi:TAXI family TRAP transporter solute-binding subunit [Nesterenkonia sphaerica]|uniref:TAXI family TRAP transporter solute-binding subunit n=1 Tax=Nesterenkonia sphaerica TaxID=1804988 RepID=A0A5R9AJ91_9MICC|nr:TAXI family TRAP transporter solute-binding subunit [Nesterenkonia sphaerica]TLP78859.1 TAXI family TRAP transporter solute-binding subunit [Nesterenkonia sphaerica]
MLVKRGRWTAAGAALAASALLLSACGDDGNGGTEGADGAEEEVGDTDAEFLTIATGGSSGVYYQIGATMADVLAEELGSDTSVQATGASAENINLITDENAELAMTMGDATVQALEGSGPFEDDPREGLMAIMTMYPNTVQLIARADAGIESVEDLAGANVAVGDVGSGVELNAQMVLGAYDMTYDDLNADYLSYAEATDQMANGHIDALFATSGLPNPALTELATNTDFITVPIDGEGRENLLSEYEFFQEATVPADTYDDDSDVETVSVTNHLIVSSELSEEAVYDITATLFDNIDRIHSSHAEAENITLETATEGLVIPLHPGAEQYYEEQGVDTDEGSDEDADDEE